MIRKILLCSLVLLLTACSGLASATAPYASIMAYNERGNKPNVYTLATLDVTNMTPWDISIGNAPQGTTMLSGMTAQPVTSFWLAGFHQPGGVNSNFGNNFAFHSMQIPLSSLNSVWKLKTQIVAAKGGTGTTYSFPTYYETIPIVFNSNSFAQGGNTVALNFSAVSSSGFEVMYPLPPTVDYYPATALSFGDGTNNYGWVSTDTGNGNYASITNFLTIQQLQAQGGNNWKPIVTNLGGVTQNIQNSKYKTGSSWNTPVQCPAYLNIGGMVYPNFSSVAGDNEGLDLVVILQAGGYTDMQLLFLAVPHSNNAFLN